MLTDRTDGNRELGKHVIEVVLEGERVATHPEQPSRLGAVHLFRSLAAAEAFIHGYRGGSGWLYSCEVLEESNSFDTHMDWVNERLHRFPTVDQLADDLKRLHERARSYWDGIPPEQALYPERIVQGRVQIAELVGRAL
jgi:hypothetical protein